MPCMERWFDCEKGQGFCGLSGYCWRWLFLQFSVTGCNRAGMDSDDRAMTEAQRDRVTAFQQTVSDTIQTDAGRLQKWKLRYRYAL